MKAGGVEWSVRRVAACLLRAKAYDWPFAKVEAAAIDAHWSRRKAEQPGFFNGRVLMMTAASMQGNPLGSLTWPVDFIQNVALCSHIRPSNEGLPG